MFYSRFAKFIALTLVCVFFCGCVVCTPSFAASEQTRNQYSITAVLQEDLDSLRISQRLVYKNQTGQTLNHVLFAVYGNVYRRESALFYESDALSQAFSAGYAPGGFQFDSITVDGESTDWGVQGESELYLRVACALEPGESCTFAFDYLLLLTQNGAFLGSGYDDWRLDGFYPLALRFEDGEFVAPSPTQNSTYTYADAADYTFTLTLPRDYILAAPGVCTSSADSSTTTWTVTAKNRHALSVSFSLRWREYTEKTSLGTEIRLFTNVRGATGALSTALKTVELYESSFGAFPDGKITLAQSDYVFDAAALDGLILLNKRVFSDADALAYALDTSLAKQYFGYAAYFMPTEDAWLSDATGEYLHYLVIEQLEGRDTFLDLLNKDLLPAIQVTIPGGLEISYDASLFTASEYKTIVKQRGALVMHNLRNAMGLAQYLEGLKSLYAMGETMSVIGEYDFVEAFDSVTGKQWEDFITDLLFNIDENMDDSII